MGTRGGYGGKGMGKGKNGSPWVRGKAWEGEGLDPLHN